MVSNILRRRVIRSVCVSLMARGVDCDSIPACTWFWLPAERVCLFLASPPFQPLTLLEPQSRFGDKPVKFQVVCPQNRTAVLEPWWVLSYNSVMTDGGRPGRISFLQLCKPNSRSNCEARPCLAVAGISSYREPNGRHYCAIRGCFSFFSLFPFVALLHRMCMSYLSPTRYININIYKTTTWHCIAHCCAYCLPGTWQRSVSVA